MRHAKKDQGNKNNTTQANENNNGKNQNSPDRVGHQAEALFQKTSQSTEKNEKQVMYLGGPISAIQKAQRQWKEENNPRKNSRKFPESKKEK